MVKNVFLYNKNLISLSNRFSVNNLDKEHHKVKRIEIFFKNNAYILGQSARISHVCVRVIDFVSFRPKWPKRFRTGCKNETKRRRFRLVLNTGRYWKYRSNTGRNTPESYRACRFGPVKKQIPASPNSCGPARYYIYIYTITYII